MKSAMNLWKFCERVTGDASCKDKQRMKDCDIEVIIASRLPSKNIEISTEEKDTTKKFVWIFERPIVKM